MTVTHAEVAETIPVHVRVSMPCPEAADHRHLWQEERILFTATGSIMAVYEDPYFWCTYCRVSTWDRPIPPVNRPWAIITAEQFLKETS